MRRLSVIIALTCAVAVPVPAYARQPAVPAAAAVLAAPAVGAGAVAAPTFNSTVWALAFRGNVVYAGGSFTEVSFRGRTYARKRLAAFDARTGAVLAWNPTANGTVRSLAVVVTGRPSVYAAGDFDEIAGARRDAVARLDATTGRAAAFSHTVSGTVADVAIGNGRIYVGGAFTKVDGVPRRSLAAFTHRTGTLDRGFRPAADGRVRALAVTRTRVYAGGDFHRMSGVARARLAAVTTTAGRTVAAFRPHAPAPVLDVAISPTGISTATGGPGGRAVAYTRPAASAGPTCSTATCTTSRFCAASPTWAAISTAPVGPPARFASSAARPGTPPGSSWPPSMRVAG
ncbi:delta-60 repeat domain-containing protein [Actinoplanes sp. NPDC051859]|uniref:delta-60 repeat domain-containing protein n=1 Tax=Actinoplanes sp. NPDC051859 TaxID=3363909 RepID=UPI0037A41376